MSRSERLLNLLQVLRQHQRPVSARVLAEKTGVSIRTLYRDIAALQSQGAIIEGEPGVGYVMKPGFMLPPLMFSTNELDALALGMDWVINNDQSLAKDAESLLSKITSVLPSNLQQKPQESSLLIGATQSQFNKPSSSDLLRQAIRAEKKLKIIYNKTPIEPSVRTIWPFALVFYEQSRIVMSWCELRNDFRNFRTDRISEIEVLEARYPKYRQQLLDEWRKTKYVPGRSILP